MVTVASFDRSNGPLEPVVASKKGYASGRCRRRLRAASRTAQLGEPMVVGVQSERIRRGSNTCHQVQLARRTPWRQQDPAVVSKVVSR